MKPLCNICLDEDNVVDTVCLPCGHTFCEGCIDYTRTTASKQKQMVLRSGDNEEGHFHCGMCRGLVTSAQKIYYELDEGGEEKESASILLGLRADLVALTAARDLEVGVFGDRLAAAQAELAQATASHAAAEASFKSRGAEAAVQAEVAAKKTRDRMSAAETKVAEEKRTSKAAATLTSEEVSCLSGKVVEVEHTVRVLCERNKSLEETLRSKAAEAMAAAANAPADATAGKKKISTLETEKERLRSDIEAVVSAADAKLVASEFQVDSLRKSLLAESSRTEAKVLSLKTGATTMRREAAEAAAKISMLETELGTLRSAQLPTQRQQHTTRRCASQL